MKKTVIKWVADLVDHYYDDKVTIECVPVELTETPKQFRVVDKHDANYRKAMGVLGYRTVINKSAAARLFDTQREALTDLYERCKRARDSAEAKLKTANDHTYWTIKALQALDD